MKNLPAHAASLVMLAAVAATAGASRPAPPAPVTWAANIAPVIDQHCAQCHHPGGPAPFSLLTYPQMQMHAQQIAQVTASRFMPPWLPDPSGIPLAHARRLTNAQIALFQQWYHQNMPKGDPQAAPPPPTAPSGWALGHPDMVLTMPKAYTLPAETTSPYRCFVLPVPLPMGRWLRAIAFQPENPPVVRQVVIFADPTGKAARLAAASGGVGYVAPDAGLGPSASRLAEWSVGSGPWIVPRATAERLPAHSDLVLMMRFETDGQPEPVRSRVGLYFAAHPPPVAPQTVMLGAPNLIVLPGQTGTVRDSFTLPVAARLLRLTPEGHSVCRTLNVQAQPPARPSQTLLHIGDWNSDWQDSYQPTQPTVLPAGTTITTTWTVDDTARNPRNPSNPPMTAEQGLFYADEMATLRLQLLAAAPADAGALQQAVHASRPSPTITLTAPRRHG